MTSEPSNLRALLRTYLSVRAVALEVKLKVVTWYNDEWWDLACMVGDVVARDAAGASVPFLDPKTLAPIPSSEFDWNDWLLPALRVVNDRYASMADIKEDGTCIVIPEGGGTASECKQIIPSGFTINLDGELLEVDERDGREHIEEIGS